ncbi:DUF2812 domain-containing protein [Bacillus sp. FJAT-45066]|uniref:DUF2812 domain-containing protein n=1 Tax=Bacillus sp. FJAT-45066 TaxID=2011010 RepID=UPI000BB7A8B8|nr:DUF2812 domain-containing protein [Bacillus sp. FJAT-45066]
MMTRFRPLWSFDVQKTETWLSEQAAKGYHLHKLHRFKRGFSFEKGESKAVTYRIGRDKNQGATLSKTLTDGGWEIVAQSGGWFVTANESVPEQIKSFTSREGIIKRNRSITYLYYFLLFYFSFVAFTNFAIFSAAYFTNIPMEVEESPFWFITYTVFGIIAAFYILMVYSVIKIHRTNKMLSEEHVKSSFVSNFQTVTILTKKEEKEFRKSGKLFKKRKFGWFYSPDKTEKWLEKMEAEGNNLYRVNKLGTTFIFLKGKSRKVKYCADYQNFSKESYFEIHRQAGWKQVYSSATALQKWTIWSKEYNEGEISPHLYSDKTHLLKHAKRVASAYSILFTPMVLMYLFITGFNLMYIYTSDTWSINEFNIIMFLITIIVFGSFITRSWMYYFRLKKETSTER